MKQPVIQAFCDIDYAENSKALVPATYMDIPLSFGDNRVTLDLCDACYEQIAKVQHAFMAMGQLDSPQRRGRRPGVHERYRRMRAFADAHDIKYITEAGQYYYSKELQTRFGEYEASQDARKG